MSLIEIFNRLVALRDDEEAFQAEAQRLVDTFITDQVGQDSQREQRLRAFQWRLEKELEITPKSQRFNKMVELFWLGVVKLGNISVKLNPALERCGVLNINEENPK